MTSGEVQQQTPSTMDTTDRQNAAAILDALRASVTRPGTNVVHTVEQIVLYEAEIKNYIP